MHAKKIGAFRVASNTFRSVALGETPCLSCGCCKAKEEMLTPDLCNTCAEEIKKARETSDFIEQLKASKPLCEKALKEKPGPIVTPTPVIFQKKTWSRRE